MRHQKGHLSICGGKKEKPRRGAPAPVLGEADAEHHHRSPLMEKSLACQEVHCAWYSAACRDAVGI